MRVCTRTLIYTRSPSFSAPQFGAFPLPSLPTLCFLFSIEIHLICPSLAHAGPESSNPQHELRPRTRLRLYTAPCAFKWRVTQGLQAPRGVSPVVVAGFTADSSRGPNAQRSRCSGPRLVLCSTPKIWVTLPSSSILGNHLCSLLIPWTMILATLLGSSHPFFQATFHNSGG